LAAFGLSRLLSLLGFTCTLFLSASAWSSFPESELTGKAAFLMNPVTGQVLYAKDADLRLPPASTTKIVTAIVVLESDAFKKTMLRTSTEATRVPRSKINLRPGYSMDIVDLLYSLLLSSANDASIVLAEGIGGSVARFAEMMTRKAAELGARNTRFTNPHGLTATGHYSTARDMALIFNHAMANPVFREIVATRTKTVSALVNAKSRRVKHIPLRNHNRLLWNFDGALGGKTGYTFAAQKCFVGAAARDGVTLTVSVLGSQDLWRDATNLLEYGLGAPEPVQEASIRPYLFPAEGVAFAQEKPVPERVAARKAPTAQPEGFELQLASFQQRESAETLRDRIARLGYPARIVTVHLQDLGTMSQVRVGPYPEMAAAQRAALAIEIKESLRPMILQVTPDLGSTH
jgi:D-alanyl-D-alanine carboxypeptidase (penicillin-binding protein 5/6)